MTRCPLTDLSVPIAPSDIEVAGRRIGAGHPAFIIAEIGVNHNGDVNLARALIDVAADCGADAVKLQTFSTNRLVTATAEKAEYQNRDASTSQAEMLARLELSEADHVLLKAHAEDRGVIFLSTPFDEGSADLLERLDVAAFKVSSGDLTHLPLLRHMARKGRPMLISTGMATLAEVEAAVDAIRSVGNDRILIFHCVSAYPTDPADANLRAIPTLAQAFTHPIGWSDHTIEDAVGWAAVALGACAVEKHITLDRTMAGPDHAASADPEQFRRYVAGIRAVGVALGDGRKQPRPVEEPIARVARRSLTAIRRIPAGDIIRDEDVAALRPAGGLAPDERSLIVGRKAARPILIGEAFTRDMVL